MAKKRLHLVCNAHIDPVWQWNLEEGISAALSTFRIAADFCEEYDGFVFNHNEAMLYQWVEDYEPALFKRIQKLVKEGKWQIMGGWFLQPDCNMPSGESFIRQIKVGKEYFQEKFGVTPTTAINFDPFGHSRGLVQILKKAGYDSYLFCRPGEGTKPIQGTCVLPDDDFTWVGFDGSEIMGHRASESYNSLMGEAGQKVQTKLASVKEGDKDVDILLWGIGNHGGGPSRIDMEEIQKVIDGEDEWEVFHSTAEAFFAERKAAANAATEQKVAKDLNPWAVGCYTSQIRIKQKHRALEGALARAEKMASAAVMKGLMEYPEEERKEAEKALILAEFHDTLPGSSIESVEAQGIRFLETGLEMADRVTRKAFFALLSGEAKAAEGEYPILAYNPHPYPVHGVYSVEFQLKDQNWNETFTMPVLYMNGQRLLSQVEKEDCNLNLDWRKKVTFEATLPPSSMTRINCFTEMLDKKPVLESLEQEKTFVFQNDRLEVVINCETGLLDSYKMDGVEYLNPGTCKLVVMESDKDPWGMRLHEYRNKLGEFRLLGDEEASLYAGTPEPIKSVRIVEDGAVRTVVEALFGYENSRACLRYSLPKNGTAVDIDWDVNWEEKGRMLKMELDTVLSDGTPTGETAFGVMEYEADGKEKVSQRWEGIFQKEKDLAFTCIDDGTYGVDFLNGVMRISMIHSAAYTAHPINDRKLIPEDRWLPYIDQGIRHFCFRLEAGKAAERRENISAEALIFQEKPMVIQAFPPGEDRNPKLDVSAPIMELSDRAVILSNIQKDEKSGKYRVRFFETTGQARTVEVRVPILGITKEISIGAYEIKTYLFDFHGDGSWEETELA